MVGGFIRWDKLFDGSPTQDGKDVAERGAFAPVVEYDDQTHAFGLPGLITEPWQAMKRWLNGGAEENVARMRTGLPFTDEAAGDAFSIAGSAAMGSVAAPKPSGAYVTSGAGGNPKSKGVQHPSDEGVDLYANPKESAALNAALQSEKQGTHLIDIVKKYGIVGAASLYGMTQGEIEQALADQGQGGFIVAPEPTVE